MVISLDALEGMFEANRTHERCRKVWGHYNSRCAKAAVEGRRWCAYHLEEARLGSERRRARRDAAQGLTPERLALAFERVNLGEDRGKVAAELGMRRGAFTRRYRNSMTRCP